MRLAIDVLSGDYAPLEIIKGINDFAKTNEDVKFILIGNENDIKNFEIPKNAEIIHTDEKIEMHEPPMEAFKNKKNSPMGIGLTLQKEGKADAFLSAGNTGALVAFSLFTLGRLKGVKRPALATFFPTKKGHTLVLDVGANSDTKPEFLYQFAIMGSVYMNKVYGIENPSVGLLSMGEEKMKGSGLIQEAHRLLEEGKNKGLLNFYGNIEGHDILEGVTDICVMDGFTGNAILKFGESLVEFITSFLKEEASKSFKVMIGAAIMKPVLKDLLKKVNYEEYGGAVVLGVDGISVKCHGKSKAPAVKSAITLTYKFYKEKVNEIVKEELEI
uniref:Phosphate acyltransferase n=1 Tax=candidate division WOR-3 bacterium TaxID=2052148 RepID=A0A7C4YC13_UNCW3